MLDVNIFMNSEVEEILEFKCCNLPEQNLEFHVINNGSERTWIENYFILENETESVTVNTIYPPWKQIIAPGDRVAYYCSFDPSEWEKYTCFTIKDCNGKEYCFDIK